MHPALGASLLLLFPFLSACEPHPRQDAPITGVASLRLLTYNLAFVPDGQDVNSVVFEDEAARAQYIADRLNDQADEIDADVMVFNEAFDEDAQDILSAELCARWPYHSRFIDEPWDDQHQDSGLMIFSRHPFATLGLEDEDLQATDHETFSACTSADADEDDPAYWSDLGFLLYEDCDNTFEDCYANKGAAVARFEHQGTGELFNIVFTHLQADDDEGPTSVRVEQMEDIRTLIEAIPDWQHQRTFVLGDLNIDGLGCSGDGCMPGVTWGDEWQAHFGAVGDFFACPGGDCSGPSYFVDSQGYGMPPTDVQRTFHGANTVFPSPLEGYRYDYILHNVPLERWVCLQQMQVLRDLVLDPQGTPVSDHYPVLADFNYRGDHCSPMDPVLVTTDPDDPGFAYEGSIALPKHVQWFEITESGTYTLDSSGPTELVVYAHDDLSYPIHSDGQILPRGLTWRLPSPPYYAKVSAPAEYTGRYSFTALRHECGHDDPCGLVPGDSDGYWAGWEAASAIGTSSRWFYFDTDTADDGTPASIGIEVDGVCSSGFEAFLRDEDGALIPWSDLHPTNQPTHFTALIDTLQPGRYTVEVHRRDNGATAPCAMQAIYTTTLTYLTHAELTCADETGGSGGPAEEAGYDEIWYHLDVDGPCTTASDPAAYTFLREFDEDDAEPMSLSGLGVRRYNRCWLLDLLEEDDISEGDVTLLEPSTVISGLSPYETEEIGQFEWNAGDYTYRMRYTLTHEPAHTEPESR